ncbi:MAG: hypothetical protein IAF38_16045, partial [Bacteroidia bacterium]|nr:hypothetical protein [Bacteroidia bacterium]
MKLINYNKSIWVIENFWTDKNCKEFIKVSEKNPVAGSNKKLAIETWMQLSKFVPKQFEDSKATGLNEKFSFFKVEKDQPVKKQKDECFMRNKSEASCFTLMIFLNDDFKGGEIKFKEISITPVRGSALIFQQ